MFAAISTIPKGKRVKVKWSGGRVTEWPHLAPPGLKLYVEQWADTGRDLLRVVLMKPNAGPDPTNMLRDDEIGNASGIVLKERFDRRTGKPNTGKTLLITNSYLRPEFQRFGLGQSMYEALLAAAWHLGARHVNGTVHSTPASRVHEKLAAKHGLEYRAFTMRDEPPDMTKDLSFDERYGAYGYDLKGLGTMPSLLFETDLDIGGGIFKPFRAGVSGEVQQPSPVNGRSVMFVRSDLPPPNRVRLFSSTKLLKMSLPKGLISWREGMWAERRSVKIAPADAQRMLVWLDQLEEQGLAGVRGIVTDVAPPARGQMLRTPHAFDVDLIAPPDARGKQEVVPYRLHLTRYAVPLGGGTASHFIRAAVRDGDQQDYHLIADLNRVKLSLAAGPTITLKDRLNYSEVKWRMSERDRQEMLVWLDQLEDKGELRGLHSSVNSAPQGTVKLMGAAANKDCKPGDVPFQKLVLERQKCLRVKVSTPEAILKMIQAGIVDKAQEHAGIVLLNSVNEVLSVVEIGVGGMASLGVDPRVVFGAVLTQGASAFVIYHSHPNGNVEPSAADIAMTNKLAILAKQLGTPMLDHVILGGDRFQHQLSFAARGLMPNVSAGPRAY